MTPESHAISKIVNMSNFSDIIANVIIEEAINATSTLSVAYDTQTFVALLQQILTMAVLICVLLHSSIRLAAMLLMHTFAKMPIVHQRFFYYVLFDTFVDVFYAAVVAIHMLLAMLLAYESLNKGRKKETRFALYMIAVGSFFFLGSGRVFRQLYTQAMKDDVWTF